MNAQCISRIPAELQSRSQWVLWKMANPSSNGKYKKIPINPNTLLFASVDDPKTWGTFDEALKALRENPDAHQGLGFVFTEGDPFVGFDFDKMKDPETKRARMKTIRKLDSYSEESPSGVGVHVVVRGELRKGGFFERGFEAYSSGRFFTVTGRKLKGVPNEIRERQDVIDELCGTAAAPNVELQTSIERSAVENIREGDRNNTLTSIGGLMRRQGMTETLISDSLKAMNSVACDPPLEEAEVAQIARSVGKYAVAESPTQAPKFLSSSEIMGDSTAEPGWIAEPLLASGCMTLLVGKPKLSGKTTLTLGMASRVVSGQDFLGKPTKKCGGVYLTEESSATFKLEFRRAGLEAAGNIKCLYWHQNAKFSWAEIVKAAVEECRRTKAEFLVIDTLSRFANLDGERENSSGEMLRVLSPLQEAQGIEGLAVLIIHHDRKGGGDLIHSGRGSTALPAAADIVVSLKRTQGANDRQRELSVISRFGASKQLIELTPNHGYKLIGTSAAEYRADAEKSVFMAIPEGKANAINIQELEKQTSESRSEIQRLISPYIQRGDVLRTGNGKKGNPYRYYRDQDGTSLSVQSEVVSAQKGGSPRLT